MHVSSLCCCLTLPQLLLEQELRWSQHSDLVMRLISQFHPEGLKDVYDYAGQTFPLFDLFFLNFFIRNLFLISDRDVLVQTGVRGNRKSDIYKGDFKIH